MLNRDHIVCLTDGSLIEVQAWRDRLRDVGIESRVVGDDLTTGFGTALPGAIELWIDFADLKAAMAEMARVSSPRRGEMATRPVESFAHPMSTPMPNTARGPQHGAPPHRPLPS